MAKVESQKKEMSKLEFENVGIEKSVTKEEMGKKKTDSQEDRNVMEGGLKMKWLGTKVQLANLVKWLADKRGKMKDKKSTKEGNYIPKDSDYWKWAENSFFMADENGEPKKVVNLAQSYQDYKKRNLDHEKDSKGVKEVLVIKDILSKIDE
jgi:hypothetical protein